MGPIWGRQNPGGPHVDPMNFATWEENGVYVLHVLRYTHQITAVACMAPNHYLNYWLDPSKDIIREI